ncbi:MAG: hypothetical protein IKO61_10115 [Lachnospiraceae bacterium]|nr:hypothetical protein [Lachnospiraceae bacterium]
MHYYLLVVILKKQDLINDICHELAEAGIRGGTIIDGKGMASVLEKMEDLPIFGMLRSILADDDDDDIVRTLWMVMNENELETAREAIHDVAGLNEPNSGIMFAVPVSFVEGLGAK